MRIFLQLRRRFKLLAPRLGHTLSFSILTTLIPCRKPILYISFVSPSHWLPTKEPGVPGEDVWGGPEGVRAGDPGGARQLNHLLPCDPDALNLF